MIFRRSDLPLERDASGRFLPWLVSVMVYLAALALICGLAMNRLVEHWGAGLKGTVTVQIPAPESPAAPDAPDPIDRVIERLLATSGVTAAEVLEPDEIADLLEPWLGAGAADATLPLPTLIAVTIDPEAGTDLDALGREIAEAAPGAVLDDHQTWLAGLVDLAHSIQIIAGLVVTLVGLSAVSMVVFATRMGLAVHAQVIELLHLVGAQDTYIAAQFQAHALKLALRGGAFGLLLAVGTLMAADRLLERAEAALLPALSIGPAEWALLAVVPLAVAAVAMVTARVTVLRTLGRLP